MADVSIELIKRVIVEKEEELNNKFKKNEFVERELKINKIVNDASTIITGIRRSGKSVLAFLTTRNKKSAYVNFEDERLPTEVKYMNKVLQAIYELKGDVEYIVFDEIQNVEGWEKFIARILGSKKIIITGSNARLLSKELSTFLTGRHIDYELFPFSFREFLRFKQFNPNIYLTKDIAKLKKYLEEYTKLGGFPLAYKLGPRFIAANYQDIIERDIIQRYNIKYGKILKDISFYYLSNISNLISFNKIGNTFNISVDTVKEYSQYFMNSYLFFFLNKFDFKLKEQERSLKKVYCVDPGIINTLSFKVSQNIGKLMENIVAIELLRRKSYWHPNLEIYYWKDYQQREVDFVIKEGTRIKQLIQVTYASSRDEIEEREVKSLLKASEILKCKNLMVITWDFEGEEQVGKKKIKFIPLWKWLLEK